MATNDHSNVPPLPTFAIGALFFLQSGDFLLQYRTTDSERSRSPLMKAGAKFVTVKDVQAAFGGSDVDSGWITPGVVRCGYCAKGDWFAYVASQQVLTLQVNFGGKEGLKKIKVPVPATVMVGMGMQYYLWAMARSGTPDSRLYRAPFPNIHDDGSICWGQNTPPKSHHRNAQAAWHLFFESQFNGDLANGKSGKYASDVRHMLKYVARKKLDSWPENDLVMHHQNLRYPLQELVGASDGQER